MDLLPVEPGLFLERNPYMGIYAPVTFLQFEDGQPRYIDAEGRLARAASTRHVYP